MAYVSPYQLSGIQENLITNLLKGKRKEEEGRFQGQMQKGEMIKEYGQDVRSKTAAIEQKQREAASKKRKKKWYEKAVNLIAPLLTVAIPGAGGAIAAGVTSGLGAGYGAAQDANFAERNLKNLQKFIEETPLTGTGKAGFDPYEGTFLSEKAADFKQGRLSAAADLDSAIQSAKDAGKFGNVFGQALTSGLTSYGMAKTFGDMNFFGETTPAKGIAGTPTFDESLGKFVLPAGSLSASQVLEGPLMGGLEKFFTGLGAKGFKDFSKKEQEGFKTLLMQLLTSLQD
jgi:hypothetical protein